MPDHRLSIEPGERVVAKYEHTIAVDDAKRLLKDGAIDGFAAPKVEKKGAAKDGLQTVVLHDDQGDLYVTCSCGWEGNNPYPTREQAEEASRYHADTRGEAVPNA